MGSFNKVILVGNLGKDPELKQLANGTVVCNFSVATSRRVGDQDKTTWHNIAAWQKTAENCGKFLKKGSKVCVEGTIDYEEFTTKDGVKKEVAKINANSVTFLSAVAKEESDITSFTPSPRPAYNPQGTTKKVTSFGAGNDDLDGIPF